MLPASHLDLGYSGKTIVASGAASVLVSPSEILMRLKLRDQHVCETTLKRKIKCVSLHDFGKKQVSLFCGNIF